MALPSIVNTGTVKGAFLRTLLDPETGQLTGVPIVGLSIVFTPHLDESRLVKVFTSTPPMTIQVEPVYAVTNEAGIVVDGGGHSEISLLASLDPDISPSGWTWDVTVEGLGFPRVAFSFYVSPGGVVDLTTPIPVSPDPGADAVAWQQAVSATLANVVAAQRVADSIPQLLAAKLQEYVADVAAQSSWTGAVAVTQAQSKSTFLRRRLTGNTVVTLAAGEASKVYSCTLELTQDATGSRSLVLAGVRTAYGVPITLTTTANAIDLIRCEWNGVYWVAFPAAAKLSVPVGW